MLAGCVCWLDASPPPSPWAGHHVLRENNYVVRGVGGYEFGGEGESVDLAPHRSSPTAAAKKKSSTSGSKSTKRKKRRQGGIFNAGKARGKRARGQGGGVGKASDDEQQTGGRKRAAKLKSVNAAIKEDIAAATIRRRAFLGKHVEAIRHFVTPKVTATLESAAVATLRPESTFAEQPPSIVGGEMRDYQLIGLQFLATMFDRGVNCILGVRHAVFCHAVPVTLWPVTLYTCHAESSRGAVCVV
jgi:hypothetical protein